MQRIYYRWEKWECYPAGFFSPHPPKEMTVEQCEQKYATFLSDIKLFANTGYKMIEAWHISTEHNLTNSTMNRIAWIGQASMCYAYGISSRFRSGYHLLTEHQKLAADTMALKIINYWMFFNGFKVYSMKSIKSRTEANLY